MKTRPEKGECSICGCEYHGGGHNTWPINNGRCCGACNGKVIEARISDSPPTDLLMQHVSGRVQ